LKYAPILITVYNRYSHFVNCIESLKNNLDSDKTEIFIAIDYPINKNEIDIHNKIINYSKNIKGFKNVNLFIREKNYGALLNSNLAKNEILKSYDRLIFTEDDNVFSPYFIKYMNENLELYKDDSNIIAVCGYQYPKVENKSSTDILMQYSFSAWGYGIWKNRISNIDYDIKDFFQYFKDPYNLYKFYSKMGNKIFIGLLISKIRNERYGDLYINYYLFKNNKKCICPNKTLVLNKGQDGTGLHSSKNTYFDKQILDEKYFPKGKAVYSNKAQKYYAKEMRECNLKFILYYILYLAIAKIKR
jgi:hypothetical protein